MKTADTKNMIIAVILSTLIIVGWQYFYLGPIEEKQKLQQELAVKNAAKNGTTAPGTDSSTPGITPQTGNFVSRQAAIAASPRIKLDTQSLSGSINLKGAVFDDVSFKNYRETVDPGSPMVTYLSPAGTTGALFAEYGWLPGTGDTVALPNGNTVWKASDGATLTAATPLVLSWDNGAGLTFERTISVDDAFMFTQSETVKNSGSTPVALKPYARTERQGEPSTPAVWVLYEGPLGVLDSTEHREDYQKLKDNVLPIEASGIGGWIGFTDKYWAISMIPDQSAKVVGRFLYSLVNDHNVYQTDLSSPAPVVIAPGATMTVKNQLFVGAKDVNIINKYTKEYNIDSFNLMNDWGWFKFLTIPMFWLLDTIYIYVGNFGIAILVSTVLIKLLFFPLQNKSYASMSKMKKIQPKIDAVRQKYADDKVQQQQAIVALYKEEKVSPLAGCLPMLISIPVFFALYKVIYTTIVMRHAPFYGWIHDLSAPDPTNVFNLFGLLPFTPPHLLTIGALPLLMGITNWLQMRLNPSPPDPVQAMIFNWMPVLFTFMMAAFPAGLVLYWTWSNILGILQQSFIMKRQGVEINFFGNIRNSLPTFKRRKVAK